MKIALLIYNLSVWQAAITGTSFGYSLWMAIGGGEHQRFWLWLGSVSLALYAVPALIYNFWAAPLLHWMLIDWSNFLVAGIGSLLGLALAFTYLREVEPEVNNFTAKLTKKTKQERNEKTDVREIDDFLPDRVAHFNPETHFDEQGFYLGLGKDGRPIYWPKSLGGLPHVQVCGTTGSGKGVFIGTLAAQCVLADEAVFYIDPKNDEYGPHVLAHAAKIGGKPFHIVDLRPGNGPQINFFNNATAEQIEELFFAGFGLAEKGSDSDFYLLDDRAAASDMAKIIQPGTTPAMLYAAEGKGLETRAKKFAGMLREMAEIEAVNAIDGLDLKKIIDDGGAVYIIGSMRNAKIVRLQRMFLVKLIQLAESRDRNSDQKPRPICVVLDELKYHISRPALEALGAARDKGLHVIMAHQSLADLRDCPADLDPAAVTGAVMENGKLKLVYKIEDPETAEWLARKSGRIQADDEMRKVDRNHSLSEKVSGERSIRQTERFFIDENMILNLHSQTPKNAGLGVVFGLGLPQFCFTSPIKVNKSSTGLQPEVFPGTSIVDKAAAVRDLEI